MDRDTRGKDEIRVVVDCDGVDVHTFRVRLGSTNQGLEFTIGHQSPTEASDHRLRGDAVASEEAAAGDRCPRSRRGCCRSSALKPYRLLGPS